MRSQIEDNVMEISSAYVQHEPVDLHFPEGEGRTRQEFAEDCDINLIMARYDNTGVISHVAPRTPMYLDLTDMPEDLASTLAMLEEAKASFMSLPATVRREFDNDPVKFVEFASDPANVGKMREWGLAEPEKAAEPVVLTASAGEASSSGSAS